MLSLLPPSDALIQRFINLYRGQLNFDYQDMKGRTALHF